MTNEEQADVIAFCNTVRMLGNSIGRNLVSGNTHEAASAAMTLCSEQAMFRRRILGQQEPADVDEDDDRLNLSALNRMFGNDDKQ